MKKEKMIKVVKALTGENKNAKGDILKCFYVENNKINLNNLEIAMQISDANEYGLIENQSYNIVGSVINKLPFIKDDFPQMKIDLNKLNEIEVYDSLNLEKTFFELLFKSYNYSQKKGNKPFLDGVNIKINSDSYNIVSSDGYVLYEYAKAIKNENKKECSFIMRNDFIEVLKKINTSERIKSARMIIIDSGEKINQFSFNEKC